MIETDDTNRVPGGDDAVFFLVIKNEREHAIKVFGSVKAMFKVLG